MAEIASSEQAVIPDDTGYDADSSYGSSELSSYATSLSSSVTNHTWENGRRFHSYKAGSYEFPNDETEQERLDLCHHIITTLLDGKLYLAPLKRGPTRVIDLACGTGLWAIEMGDLHPEVESIVGNDLSPIQPSWVPPNVKFYVDDIESDWIPGQTYDYIHGRYLACSIKDWPRLVSQCYRNLEEDGWVEFQDYDLRTYSEDGTLKSDSALHQFHEHIKEAADKMGRTSYPGPQLKKWVEEAGFVNVGEKVFKLPIGPWAREEKLKKAGGLHMLQFLDGLEAFTVAMFTHHLGWSLEQIQLFLVDVRKDAKLKNVHALNNFHVVWGQKPKTQ